MKNLKVIKKGALPARYFFALPSGVSHNSPKDGGDFFVPKMGTFADKPIREMEL